MGLDWVRENETREKLMKNHVKGEFLGRKTNELRDFIIFFLRWAPVRHLGKQKPKRKKAQSNSVQRMSSRDMERDQLPGERWADSLWWMGVQLGLCTSFLWLL